MTLAKEKACCSKDTEEKNNNKESCSSTNNSTDGCNSRRRRILIHGIPSSLFSDFLLFDPRVSRLQASSSPLSSAAKHQQEEQHYFKPPLDVVENSKEFKVICSVPGLARENLKIDIDEEVRVLTISGKIEPEKYSEEKVHVMERNSGSFKRTIYLPKQANLEQVNAQLENGVLRIIISKSEEKKKIRTIRLSNL